MNAIDQQLAIFEKADAWQHRESRRLLRLVQRPGQKRRAWKQLMELALRQEQFRREFNRFLENAS